jgi:hypothetical protein
MIEGMLRGGEIWGEGIGGYINAASVINYQVGEEQV